MFWKYVKSLGKKKKPLKLKPFIVTDGNGKNVTCHYYLYCAFLCTEGDEREHHLQDCTKLPDTAVILWGKESSDPLSLFFFFFSLPFFFLSLGLFVILLSALGWAGTAVDFLCVTNCLLCGCVLTHFPWDAASYSAHRAQVLALTLLHTNFTTKIAE